jgi:hypothetical protein
MGVNVKHLSAAFVLAGLLLASSPTQADPPVPPWVGRVSAALRKLFRDEAYAHNVATAIQQITHPSGSLASLSRFDVGSTGPEVRDPQDYYTVNATMTVTWLGALGGSRTISVRWDLERRQHAWAHVEEDDAPLGVSKGNAKKLDDYFRRLYPSVMQIAGVR